MTFFLLCSKIITNFRNFLSKKKPKNFLTLFSLTFYSFLSTSYSFLLSSFFVFVFVFFFCELCTFSSHLFFSFGNKIFFPSPSKTIRSKVEINRFCKLRSLFNLFFIVIVFVVLDRLLFFS